MISVNIIGLTQFFICRPYFKRPKQKKGSISTPKMQQSLSESTLFYTNGKAWELYTVTQVVDFYNIHKNPLQQENTTYEAFTFTQLSKL